MQATKAFLFAGVILFILGSSAQAYRPVIDLGTLGGNESRAYSINDNGQIVGGAYNSSNYYHACLFDSTGGGANIDLGSGAAYSINDSGQIVGSANGRACLFDPTGGGANIILSDSSTFSSRASSINNNGLIVGNVVNLLGQSIAYLFDPTGGGNNIPIGTWGGLVRDYFSNTAYAINDSNVIVGQEVFIKSLFGQTVTYKAASRYDVLSIWGWGLSLDDDTSCALFINNNGQIVGWTNLLSGYSRACLFDPTGGGDNTNLGTLSGYNYSIARFINDGGQIVGEAFTSTSPLVAATYRACLFDSTGQGNNIDLNTLIDPSSGWTLTYANSINNNGWIVGYGVNPDGYGHAYLLTPEPASAIIIALGGVFLSLRRRRR